jgi:hypothetical protein
MGGGEIEDEGHAARYLVCRYPSWIPSGDAFESGRSRLFNGLMGISVVKPVQTLGFIHSRQRLERRSPMDAGPWAMRQFDHDLLLHVPRMIERIPDSHGRR